MQYSFTYDIIEDGDNYLKGKIAELIFERVRSKLLRKITHCCGVTELKHFLTAYPPEARSMNVNSPTQELYGKAELRKEPPWT